MNLLDIQLRAKSVGVLLLLASTLILCFTIFIAIFLIPFGLKSGLNILSLIPFLLIAIFTLVVCGLGIYVGIRYFKGKVFKKNKSLGTVLVIFGLFYLLYSLISYFFSNLTGNIGGEIQPILALVWAVVTIPFGLVLRNGVK
jgi:Na+-driven multidrug efflux pump